MGSHKVQKRVEGFYFSVWAPNAKEVSVIGNLMVGILRHINCFGDGMVLGFGKVL